MVSAFVDVTLPNMSTNERSLLVSSSSFPASRAFQASQTDFSIAIIASALGSAAGAAGPASGAALSSFFDASFSASGLAVAAAGALGSTSRFSPWNAASHLSPLLTQTVAARIGLGALSVFPSTVQAPSNVPL